MDMKLLEMRDDLGIVLELSFREAYTIMQSLDEIVQRCSNADITEIMSSTPEKIGEMSDQLLNIFESEKKDALIKRRSIQNLNKSEVSSSVSSDFPSLDIV